MSGFRGPRAALLALLPQLGVALPPEPPPDGHPWEEATCVIDVLQATYQLAEAGNGINEALVACPPKNSSNRQAVAICSLTVGNTLSSFLQAAVTISSSLGDCAETTNYGAACAADVLDLQANLAQAVDGTSAFIGGVCGSKDKQGLVEEVEHEDVNVSRLPEYRRYLFLRKKVEDYDQFVQDRHLENLAQRKRATQIAMCTFSVGEALFYLTRTILALHDSVLDCSRNQTAHTEGRLLCTVQIAGVINALANVAAYGALLIENCQFKELFDCTAEVSVWVQVVAGLVQDGADFPLSCGKELKPGQVVDLANRRLSRSLPSSPEVFV